MEITLQSINEEELIKAIKNPTVFDIAIIGGGVAGLTAGLYAARDGFKTLVLEGTIESSTDSPGGALLLTSEIANYPGFEAAEGIELVTVMRTQALSVGADIREERAAKLDLATIKGKCHGITTNEGNEYRARAIILASGAVAKRLGVPGEDEMYGRGVSSCGTCDGFFFRDKIVAVAGGGDTAVEDALLLTHYAEKVYLLVRGDKLKASGPEAREVINHPDVEIHWNTSVQEVITSDNKENVIGVKIKEKDEEKIISLDGLFVAIGSNPATSFLEGTGIALDSERFILVNGASTEVLGVDTGVFAAGDVADKVYRQAITSAGKAAQAALEARSYLNSY
jgi:thioredoxin reductase (NADPH)